MIQKAHYTTIASNHDCGTVWGIIPIRCHAGPYTPSQCQDFCDAFPWCIAYSSRKGGLNDCAIIPSTGECPVGDFLSGARAALTGYLRPGHEHGYSCMAKNPPTPTPTASPTPYPTTPTPTTSPTSSPTTSPTQVPNQCAKI